jgi:hypothetical protein
VIVCIVTIFHTFFTTLREGNIRLRMNNGCWTYLRTYGIQSTSRDSSVGIATRLTGWAIGVLGFDSLWGLGIFLFTTASRTALGPTQPPIQWVPGGLSLGVKRPGREDDHSHPSSAEVKECVELYFHSPNTPSWRGAQLKHRDNFTFTFYLHKYCRSNRRLSKISEVLKLTGYTIRCLSLECVAA